MRECEGIWIRKPDLVGPGSDLYLICSGGEKEVEKRIRKGKLGRTRPQEARFQSKILSYLINQPYSTEFIGNDENSLRYVYIQGRELFYSADGDIVGKALGQLHNFTSTNPPKFLQYKCAKDVIVGRLMEYSKKMQGMESKSNMANAVGSKSNMPNAVGSKSNMANAVGSADTGVKSFLQKKISSSLEYLSNKDGFEKMPCLVHNDLTTGNVLIDKTGQAHFIDWSWALHSDAVLDLLSFTCPAVTSWEYEHFISDKQFMHFINAYFDERKFTKKQIKEMKSQFRHFALPYLFMTLSWVQACFSVEFPQDKRISRLLDIEFIRKGESVAKRLIARL